MLIPILCGVFVVALIIAGIAIGRRPATFTVSRSTNMAVPPDRAFAQVVDFHAWMAWSPWEGLDPKSVRTFSGSPSGLGAVYGWDGNGKVGKGVMTITAVQPTSHIGITIEFMRPFAATNQVTFDFVPTDTGCTVTWTMRGNNTFMGKAMSLFINCEAMIGGPFAQGLAKLKTICETQAS